MTARISGWPGIELSAADLYERKVTQTRFRPDAKYAWSAGEAMSRLLAELQNGRLIARSCHKCKRILFPPRMFCEECFRPTDEWTFIHDTGTIETFSISYLDTDAKRIAEPILVGVVSLDGATPKMGMMHFFGEMTKEEIRIGMRVKAEWKPPLDRQGSVLDIPYFPPLREGERRRATGIAAVSSHAPPWRPKRAGGGWAFRPRIGRRERRPGRIATIEESDRGGP